MLRQWRIECPDAIHEGTIKLKMLNRLTNLMDAVPTVSYTRGSDLSGTLEGAGGIGGLLARSVGRAHGYYHADGNGNISALAILTLYAQALAASYRYDPFGNTTSMSGSLADANVYRFSSKEYHTPSGLYYYGHRWYAPSLQRWPNRDPLGELGGHNLYGFVSNNPINRRDSLGLTSAECEAARQALADALRNFRDAPGPLTQEALVAAVAEEAAACSDDRLPPLPPPTPFPVCKPAPYRTPPFPTPPPLHQSFCARHPLVCGGVVVGIVVGVVCIAQPELCVPALILAPK